MIWLKKRTPEERIDTEELLLKGEASLREVKEQQPHVNFLTRWLENRTDQNGFGEDFEFTLLPKEAE